MKTKKRNVERLIYQSSFYDDYEEAIQMGKESIEACERYDDLSQVTETEIWDEYIHLKDLDWEDEKERLEEFFQENEFLVVGTLGLWNGRFAAGKIISSVSELSQAWDECADFKLYDQGGHFFIEGVHHDGRNCFEMKKLTPRGVEYADRHSWDSDREVHEKLWNNSNYTVLPRYADAVYGKL